MTRLRTVVISGVLIALGSTLPAAGQTPSPPPTTCVLLIICAPSSTPPGPTTATTTAAAPAPQAPAASGFRLGEGSPTEARLIAHIQSSRAQRQALDAQIAGLTTKVVGLEQERRAAEASLREAEAREREVHAKLDDGRRQVEGAEEDLRRVVVLAYVRGTSAVSRVANLIVNNRPTGEVELAAGYARAAMEERAQAVRRLKASRTEMENLQPQVDSATKAAAALRDGVATRAAAVAASRRSLSELSPKLSAKVAEEEALVQQVFSSREEFEGRFQVLLDESDVITALLRSRGADGPPAKLGSRRLISPVLASPLTSPFGPRVHPVFGTVRMHNGVDLAASNGTPVVAVDDGVVLAAGYSGGYGNRVLIAHGGSLATLSAHLGEISVTEGQQVTRGQSVGAVGCTGLCTGPHLHFEVRIDGAPVDPTPWL